MATMICEGVTQPHDKFLANYSHSQWQLRPDGTGAKIDRNRSGTWNSYHENPEEDINAEPADICAPTVCCGLMIGAGFTRETTHLYTNNTFMGRFSW